MALDKNLFTNWVEGQQFTARDYVYERNLIIDYINNLTNLSITELAQSVFDARYYQQAQVNGIAAALQDQIDDRVKYTDLTSSLNLYPTTQQTALGYGVLVTSLDDPRYDQTAVDFPVTPFEVSGTEDIRVAQLSSDPGIIIGTPGVLNVTTVGKVKKIAGGSEQGATFYYKIYKSANDGSPIGEPIAVSDPTITVLNTVYEEFSASAIFDNGTFAEDNGLYIEYWAKNVGGGSPTFQFEFGGDSPVRTILPVPLTVIPTGAATSPGYLGYWKISTTVPADAEHITTLREDPSFGVIGYGTALTSTYNEWSALYSQGSMVGTPGGFRAVIELGDGTRVANQGEPVGDPFSNGMALVTQPLEPYDILVKRPDIPDFNTAQMMLGYFAYQGELGDNWFYIDTTTSYPHGYGLYVKKG